MPLSCFGLITAVLWPEYTVGRLGDSAYFFCHDIVAVTALERVRIVIKTVCAI